MIQKIDIAKFGIYQDYKWDACIGKDFYFKTANIIYGRNYSGKTSLSRIFRSLEKNALHQDFLDSNFEFILSDGKKINNANISQEKIKIYVYNRDFVKDNLSWLHKDDGTIEPFTIIGETNNEIQKELDNIDNELGSVEDKKGLAYELSLKNDATSQAKKVHKDKEESLNKKLTDKAKAIKNETAFYNVVNYNISQIQSDINALKASDKLTDEQLELHKQLLKEDVKEDIKILPESKPKFEEYLQNTNELISKKIQPTQAIADLVNDHLLQAWVEQGVEMHKGKRETCAFCGNPIEPQLWNKIDAHFNQESKELNKAIATTIESLQKGKTALDSFIKFSKTNFYSSFHLEFETFLAKCENEKAVYSTNIQTLIDALVIREKDIFKSLNVLSIQDNSEKISELFKEVNLLIAKNNEKTKTLAQDQAGSRKALRLSEVMKFIDEIKYTDELKAIEQAKIGYEKVDNERKALHETIETKKEAKRKLETQQQDESKGAKQVNMYLEKIGHSGFKLVAVGEKPNIKFKIIRDGQEAKNLSDGETSLISFCYFMATIKDKLDTDTIIYIDDPISSLDNNHIFFMFSLIDTEIAKTKNFRQLFISTHNLDFLKYLKRLSIVGFKDNVSHYLIERKRKQNDNRSFLLLMPDYLKDYITEFNYLFKEIYSYYKVVNGDRTMQITNTYNLFYNLPNNMRKFLEYYLFYKFPNSDSPLNNLDKLFDNEVPSLLNRVINELSHLTHIDRGWSPIDVNEAEECVKIIIEKIKEKDLEQFNALLESIGEAKHV